MIMKRASSVFNHVLMMALLSVPSALFAATDGFEAFRQQQRQGTQQLSVEFQAYKEKQDAEFADFLKTQWREFETFRGKVRIKEPKPHQAPVVAPPVFPAKPAAPVVPNPVAPSAKPPVTRPIVVAPVVLPPPPSLPVPPKPVPRAADMLEIGFYGNPVSFAFDPRWRSYRWSGNASPEAMSAFWSQMSGSRYESTIQGIAAVRRDLKLDDWGHVALWRAVVQALQPERKTEQSLLLWYFLIKSGYDVRLGYAAADVYLFVAVRQPVYATKFTTVGQQTYYALLAEDRGDSIGRFYTYEASYPVKLRPVDIHSAATAFTQPSPAQRDLKFDFKGETITIRVPYDRALVAYLASFPQSDFELYFNTDGSSLLRHGLVEALRRHTAKMDEESAVNFLLAFVQKSFAYKTDDDQFGREKYFFVEESLHYPYNDCEDRSVIFAWLVNELLGIRVIGLLYPGHMTTAVALGQVRPGLSTIDHQGKRFVIADPTYIGSTAGMAMPSYAQLKPSKVVDMQYRLPDKSQSK